MLRDSAKRVDTAMLWLSRTISMLVVLAGPALLGQFADRHFGTGPWLASLGILVGITLFVGVMTVYTRRFMPTKPDPASDSPQPSEQDEP